MKKTFFLLLVALAAVGCAVKPLSILPENITITPADPGLGKVADLVGAWTGNYAN